MDSAGNVGQSNDIALSGFDDPHISCYDFSNGDLKYAARLGENWTIWLLDEEGYVGMQTSLALDNFIHCKVKNGRARL